MVTDMSCRGRLAVLNEKITRLERKIEYLEARVIFLIYCNRNLWLLNNLCVFIRR